MNMLSIMLYSEVTTLAMMAGSEYCSSRGPIGFVPNVTGEELLFCEGLIIYIYTNQRHKMFAGGAGAARKQRCQNALKLM